MARCVSALITAENIYAGDKNKFTPCSSTNDAHGVNFKFGLLLSLAKNSVDLGATDWADALCHATTRV